MTYRAKENIVRRSMRGCQLVAVLLGLLFGASAPTRADLMLVLQPGPGVAVVGQPAVVDLIAEGSTTGEHITSNTGGAATIFPGTFTNASVVFGPDPFADLTTDPILFIITFTPTATGTYQITEGHGLSVTTNLATYNFPGTIGPLDLTVVSSVSSVPEPSSTAIVAVFGAVFFLAYGWTRRREQRRQAAA